MSMPSEELIEEAQKEERRRFRFWRWVFSLVMYTLAASVLLIAAAAGLGYILYDHVTGEGIKGPAIEVAVPKGATGREIGALLVEKGLLEHEGFFRLAQQLDTSGGIIQHGSYDLNQGFSASQLLRQLQAGPAQHLDVDQVKVTIPEGLAVSQVAELRPDGSAYEEAARDPKFLQQLPVDVPSLEGFLMPDTYFFDTEPSAEELITRQLSHFHDVYDSLVKDIPGSEEYDLLSIVTIASLVEEEARVDEERPVIAAVMYNRLEKGMPLQMDSTLQYALGKYGQRMLNEDKEVDSPYNTYRNAGLPPGPISSPGAASLRAALAPAKVDYLFFVSNADGKTHTFSSTMAEHERAVARYRREIAQQRRELGQ